MAKLLPADRWKMYILEQIKALRLSDELKGLRSKGLASLGRTKMYSFQEWWDDFGRRATAPAYLIWYQQCSVFAERFRLAPWVVSNLCLLKGYRPEDSIGLMAMEADWPKVRFITDSNNETFVKKLSYEAQQLGVYVIQTQGSSETPILNLEPKKDNHSNPSLKRLGTGDKFFIRVELPVEYPPEAAAQLQRDVSQLAKELARRMGYDIPKRLRTSKLVSMTEELKIKKKRLSAGDSYNIIDRIYPDDLKEDQNRRKLVSSQRQKLRRRLVKPYEPDDKPSK